MRIKNEELTLSGTDLQSDITSNEIYVAHAACMSIQVVTTGTPNGSFKIQGSNDNGASETNLQNATITNWADISNTSTNVTSADRDWETT